MRPYCLTPPLILFYLFIVAGYSLSAQPYVVGKTSITFTDASRNNRTVPVDIYYPALQAGNDVPIANTGEPRFPVISMGHGFLMSVDAYANLWNALVPEGFIVALPRTETSLLPSHGNFGKDLAFVINQMNMLSQKSGNIFFNKVDSMNCVMGHSMGGGAAHLAAAGSTVIKSMVTFAAAETNPSAISASSNITIPGLIFSGGNDCVTPPADNQIPIYNALKSACKTYISIKGGGHCYMADSSPTCEFGESTCSPAPAITRQKQHTIINSYLIPWLQYQLKNNCNAGRNFENLLSNNPDIEFQNSCSFCRTSNVLQTPSTNGYVIFPNPFDEKLLVEFKNSQQKPKYIKLKSIEGKTFRFIDLTNKPTGYFVEINTTAVPKGNYLLEIVNKNERAHYQLIKAQ